MKNKEIDRLENDKENIRNNQIMYKNKDKVIETLQGQVKELVSNNIKERNIRLKLENDVESLKNPQHPKPQSAPNRSLSIPKKVNPIMLTLSSPQHIQPSTLHPTPTFHHTFHLLVPIPTSQTQKPP